MSREWFSAAELAGLPGMPKYPRGVNLMGDRGDIERRKRTQGKGWEYLITSLPSETRAHLGAQALRAKRASDDDAAAGGMAGRAIVLRERLDAQVLQRQREAGLAATTGLTGGTAARLNARVAVLTLLAEYRQATGLGNSRAIESFCQLYNSGEIEASEDVRSLIPTVERATLYRWKQRQSQQGALGLVDNRGKALKGQSKIDTQPMLKDFCQAMVADHPHCGASHLIESAQARFAGTGIELPSKRSFERWLNSYRKDNAQLLSATANPDEWKNRYMLASGSASEDVFALNQRWELDGTPADVMLLDGRHSINGVIDVFTRRVKLLVTKTPTAVSVATLLRRTLLHWGVPETVKTDNGSDYKAFHIRRLMESLEIEQEFCTPFSAWEKPHIERFFKTFSHSIVELLDGYIGHNVAERSAIESRKSFADRLLKKNDVVEIKLTSTELQRICDEWVENIYHHRAHKGLSNRSPFAVANAWNHPIRRIENERALDVLLAQAPSNNGQRTVTKKGISLDNIEYIHQELGLLVGEQVSVKYDPDDLGKVYVFDRDGAFVCIAEAPAYTGISRREVATVGREKQKKAVQEKRRELKVAARTQNTKGIADEILANARSLANIAELPKRGETYTTPALEAAGEAASHQDEHRATSTTTEQRDAARARAVASFNQPREVVQDATTRMDPRQLYLKAVRIEQRLEEGRAVDEGDIKWLKAFSQTSTYRSQQKLAEDFGLAEQL
ncbi:MAG: Mu transposase C-terminal domain-containing protein [Porticoccaceae bacterium]|nr:Mu transposase C-terminal domain-containing protein [Porticoccaceae bacterium]